MKQTHDSSELLDFGILVLGTVNWPLTVPTSGFNIPSEVFTITSFSRRMSDSSSFTKQNTLAESLIGFSSCARANSRRNTSNLRTLSR
jgi:hypothetical protein